jgi:3-oxoacyl-[acyl-carrier protein] reductase
MNLGLKGRCALVTGGSRGIGRAIALRLAEEGCNVGICARSKEPLADALSAITAYGVDGAGIQCDATDPTELEKFISASVAVLGEPDILVCNVGTSRAGRFEDTTDSDWVRAAEINTLHCVRAIRTVLPMMKRRGGGAVLIVSSISGWKPVRIGAAYGAAKAAEIHLAASLGQELAAYGVRVNAMSPGSTLFEGGGWDRYRRDQPSEFQEFADSQFPYKRLATVDEIADVAVFLVSDRARWINGANIPVDGGQREPSAFR